MHKRNIFNKEHRSPLISNSQMNDVIPFPRTSIKAKKNGCRKQYTPILSTNSSLSINNENLRILSTGNDHKDIKIDKLKKISEKDLKQLLPPEFRNSPQLNHPRLTLAQRFFLAEIANVYSSNRKQQTLTTYNHIFNKNRKKIDVSKVNNNMICLPVTKSLVRQKEKNIPTRRIKTGRVKLSNLQQNRPPSANYFHKDHQRTNDSTRAPSLQIISLNPVNYQMHNRSTILQFIDELYTDLRNQFNLNEDNKSNDQPSDEIIIKEYLSDIFFNVESLSSL
ncbi:hypothetical protein SNEBB_002772 [Seison nebaliae]|nr:hypothetical protein SNEBB_002772 [Seison nebaliae]